MASYVQIANLAASKLGEDDQIRSPTDDTHVARSIAAVWELVRRSALRDHPWNFAMRRAELAALATAAPYPWGFTYQLPADSVRLIEVFGYRREQYQLEGGAILSDAIGPLRIRYVADVAETARWDDAFVDAFACLLAYQIAERITGDRARKSDCWQNYRVALAAAKRVDARENPPVPFEPTGWETARHGAGWTYGPEGDWGRR